MKKLFVSLTLVVFMASFAFAGNKYKLNDNTLEKQFQKAEPIQFNTTNMDALAMTDIATMPEGKTVGGFVIRWLVCSALIWSHRKYMGTGGQSVWYYYCIPIYGTVIGCGELIDVVFGGEDALSDYEGNGAACVWCN